MKLGAALTHFTHVAEHQKARRGQLGQHLDGGAHRIRVGVVTVVHHGQFMAGQRQLQRTRAALDRLEGRQTRRNGGQRHTCGQRASGSGQRVVDVVATGHTQGKLQRARRRCGLHLPAAPGPVGAAGDIGGAGHCKGDDAARTGQRAPQRRVRVIRRKHGHTCIRQGADHRAVFTCDGFHGGHEFEVLTLRVVDQRHRWLRHGRQFGDLAGVVHAQLNHAQLMTCAQTQQGQRHANVVVEIAFSGKRLLALEGAQDGRDHLRHRGLAVAAGHRHQRQRELGTPAGGQAAQGSLAVAHLQARQAGLKQSVLSQRGDGATGTGLRQKIMRIKALAFERHKQVTGAQAARVGVNALKAQRGIAHPLRTRQQLRCLRQRHHVRTPVGCALRATGI